MAKNMKKNKNIVNYDAREDVLYLGVKSGVEEEFAEIAPGISVELDQRGNVIGVEILNASKILKPVMKPLQKQISAPVALVR